MDDNDNDDWLLNELFGLDDELDGFVEVDGYIPFSRLTPYAKRFVNICELEDFYGRMYVSKTTLIKAQIRATRRRDT